MATINFGGLSVEAITNNSSSETKTLANNVTTVSLTINSGTFDLSTYNCTSTGATTLSNANSTLKIGTSSNTGLTTAGITWNTGTKRDWQEGSKINCSGNWIEPNENISTTSFRGTVTYTGSGNIAKPYNTNTFYSVTVNAGVTLTATAGVVLTGASSYDVNINGTLALGSNLFYIGATNSIIFGVASDITGTGTFNFYSEKPTTITNLRESAFSFTGTFSTSTGTTNNNIYLPAWDFSNANVTIGGGGVNGLNRYIGAGTLKCKQFTLIHYNNNSFIVDNSTYNPSFYISQGVTVTPGTGGLTYTKGTGTITLDGTSGTSTIDFAGKSVEAIVVAAGTGIKEFASNCTCTSLRGTAGTIRSTVAGTQRTITTLSSAADTTGTTFKDIKILGYLVNCKDKASVDAGSPNTNTNAGNCSGLIVFKDRVLN